MDTSRQYLKEKMYTTEHKAKIGGNDHYIFEPIRTKHFKKYTKFPFSLFKYAQRPDTNICNMIISENKNIVSLIPIQ